MVVIHVKFGQEDEFLYETTCATSNDELIRGLVKLNNTRVRIAFLCGALRELGTHGPAKPMGEVRRPRDAPLPRAATRPPETGARPPAAP